MSLPAALDPAQFQANLRASLESERRMIKPRSWWPSMLGHQCDRYLVWSFTRYDEGELHDYVLESIFNEGRLHQKSMYDRLEAMGYEIAREHHRSIEIPVAGTIIACKPDMWFLAFKGHRFDRKPPADGKSCQGHDFERIDTIEDVKESPRPWVRGYHTQLNLYLLADNEPLGFLVLKSKATGLLKLIPMELDYQAAEETLQRVERLQPMVMNRVDPDPIAYTEAVCSRCKFRGICYPPRSFGQGASLIFDTELADQIERRAELKPAASEYGALDKAIKAKLKREGVKQAICGDYLIQGTEIPVKAFTVGARTDTRYEITKLTPTETKAEPAEPQPKPVATQPKSSVAAETEAVIAEPEPIAPPVPTGGNPFA